MSSASSANPIATDWSVIINQLVAHEEQRSEEALVLGVADFPTVAVDDPDVNHTVSVRLWVRTHYGYQRGGVFIPVRAVADRPDLEEAMRRSNVRDINLFIHSLNATHSWSACLKAMRKAVNRLRAVGTVLLTSALAKDGTVASAADLQPFALPEVAFASAYPQILKDITRTVEQQVPGARRLRMRSNSL